MPLKIAYLWAMGKVELNTLEMSVFNSAFSLQNRQTVEPNFYEINQNYFAIYYVISYSATDNGSIYL